LLTYYIRWRARWRAAGCTRIQEDIRRCEAGTQVGDGIGLRGLRMGRVGKSCLRGTVDWHVISAARRSRRKITAEGLVGAARNGQTDGVWTAEDPRDSALG
jgi:hypothetical protein